jgi:serine/threonine protein kinase
LLFVDLGEARNVVRVIDSGEHGDDYVLVMPRAKKSLRQHISERGQPSADEAVAGLSDVAPALEALEDLDGLVVHRDLKPENVLFLDGRWSLADFGISRYAESTTAPDTGKYAMTPPYAAPEQWRWERATGATGIYALGVMAYEMLVGTRPFPGPGRPVSAAASHVVPARVQNVSVSLAALVAECLQKQPETRPTATEIVRRLRATAGSPRRPSLARLRRPTRRRFHSAPLRRDKPQSPARRRNVGNSSLPTPSTASRPSRMAPGRACRGCAVD